MSFPRIEHISQVLPAVEGRAEFVVRERDGYTSIDYIYVLPDSFDCPIRRECRGIKFDAVDGRILARPYHKFFNLGEKEETQPHVLDLSRPHVVTEKLDGSMVHPARAGRRLTLMTRAGETEVSKAALALSEHDDAFWDFCFNCLEEERTPIFEYTAPDNRIVIAYDEPRLTLLAVRDNVTGEYLDVHELYGGSGIDLAPWMGCLIPEDRERYFSIIRKWRTAEGIVIRFGDGLHVKLKADDYVLRHRAKDEVGLEKNAFRVVLEGAEDDLCALLPEGEANALAEYSKALKLDILSMQIRVEEAVERGKGMERKTFATEVVPTLPPLLRPAAFAALDGSDPWSVIVSHLLRAARSGPRLEAVLKEYHLPRWATYWLAEEEEPS